VCNERSPKDTAGKQSFLHTLFVKDKEQTKGKKYRAMFFYLIDNHMQKFRHF